MEPIRIIKLLKEAEEALRYKDLPAILFGMRHAIGMSRRKASVLTGIPSYLLCAWETRQRVHLLSDEHIRGLSELYGLDQAMIKRKMGAFLERKKTIYKELH